MASLANESRADESVGEVRGAVNGEEVDLRVVRQLIPLDKPDAAREERLEAMHAQEDLIAFGPDAVLERRVVVVAERLLALREEATVLRAEVDVSRPHIPLAGARIEDAHAAARDHHVKLVLRHVVTNVRGLDEESLALLVERARARVIRAVVARAREGHVEACAARAARVSAWRRGKGVCDARVVRIDGWRVVDAGEAATTGFARTRALAQAGVCWQ